MKHATEFYDSIPKELDPRCLEVALDLARQASESLYANYNNVKKLCTTLLGWTVAASMSLVAAIVAQIPNGWNLQMIMTAYGLALSLTTSLVIILGGLFKRDWYLPGLEPTSCLSKARLKYLTCPANRRRGFRLNSTSGGRSSSAMQGLAAFVILLIIAKFGTKWIISISTHTEGSK